MYTLKLYITLDDLNTHIHNHVDEAYKNHTFIPVKTEFNEHDNSIEISLVSANPIDSDGRRYKLDVNKMAEQSVKPKQDTDRCRDCARYPWDMPHCKDCNAENHFKYFERW